MEEHVYSPYSITKPRSVNSEMRNKPVVTLDDKMKLCRQYGIEYKDLQQIAYGYSDYESLEYKVKNLVAQRKAREVEVGHKYVSDIGCLHGKAFRN